MRHAQTNHRGAFLLGVRKPGFAPGPSPSQGEMLLLHHNPDGSWSPWSDSHRRIRVYKTRPVAAEAQGRWKWGIKNCELRMRGASPVRSASGVGVRHSPFSIRHLKWCSHVDLHHEPPPSQGGVQGSRYTLRALASVAGLAPARTCLKAGCASCFAFTDEKWSPRQVSHLRLLLFREALICLSYPGIVGRRRTGVRRP